MLRILIPTNVHTKNLTLCVWILDILTCEESMLSDSQLDKKEEQSNDVKNNEQQSWKEVQVKAQKFGRRPYSLFRQSSSTLYLVLQRSKLKIQGDNEQHIFSRFLKLGTVQVCT